MPQRTSLKRKAPGSLDHGRQQQISSLLGDRIRKPRALGRGVPPILKKAKLESDANAVENPATQQPLRATVAPVAAQKRKWHLSELRKRDREARKMREHVTPAFVFEAPHMDSRRPHRVKEEGSKPPAETVANSKRVTGKLSPALGKKSQNNMTEARPALNGKCVFSSTADVPGIRSHGASGVPGGEAILYSRSMLPSSHLLLLDVLVALESAMVLLRSRRIAPTLSAVQDIVRKSTRREFTVKILSQLAHVVPEAVAVLPGLKRSSDSRGSESMLIIRLDDVNLNLKANLEGEKIASRLGDAAVRSRRSLLHKRLLDHVKEHHIRFLDSRSIKRHESDVWHSDFDLEREVPELPAPPLHALEVGDRPHGQSTISKRPKPTAPRINDVGLKKDEAASRHGDDGKTDTDGIPLDLLRKVRERVKAREVQNANAAMEKGTNRSLLSKLPCTMDTICSVLRGERRSAMGWAQLIGKVEKLHPRKWAKEDLERQLDAITVLAGDWCKKVELKSSRGGFAFRVVSEASFGKARLKVSTTEKYDEGVACQ